MPRQLPVEVVDPPLDDPPLGVVDPPLGTSDPGTQPLPTHTAPGNGAVPRQLPAGVVEPPLGVVDGLGGSTGLGGVSGLGAPGMLPVVKLHTGPGAATSAIVFETTRQ